MAHDHAVSNLKVAFLLNLAFTVLETAGGFWTNSVAILSDAVHDAGDCFSLGLAWYLQWLSARRPDARFTYGYRRMSLAGALVTGMVLVAGLAYVAWEATGRLRNPEPVLGPGIIALALLGILFNGSAAWRMRHGDSLAERMASWHLIEDTVGWIAVLAGGAAMSVWNVPIIDPILALLIAVVILFNVFRNLRRVAMVFLQASPAGFDAEAFHRQMREIPGVIDAHHTHTWSVDGQVHVFSTHLVMAAGSSRDQIVGVKRRVHQLLREHHFGHTTVEIELAGEQCAGEADCE
jgi:cobalt-zinc-cadmium efflux system protein